MTKSGKILRNDVISDEAFQWAEDYEQFVEKACKANQKLTDSISELNKAKDLTFILPSQNENNVFTKRLNLLAIIMDTVLETNQKTKIFNLLQSLEGIDNCKYASMHVAHGNAILTSLPIAYTDVQVDKLARKK